MAKKSMTPSERREAILKVLCQRRQDKIDNLAFEFGVSVRTIKNDIEELSLAYPIETVRGRYGGGVKVADGYYVGRNYLKPKQQELLKKLQSTLQGDDLEVMNSILRDFALTRLTCHPSMHCLQIPETHGMNFRLLLKTAGVLPDRWRIHSWIIYRDS